MNRIEILAKKFEDHISLPWQHNLAAAEKTIFVVYPKEDERRLRAKRELFHQASLKAGHFWHEVLLDTAFPDWMASQDYAEDYFAFPEDIRQKLEIDFANYLADRIGEALSNAGEDDALGLFGVGTVFGLTHVSSILQRLENAIKGRLIVFFPGSHEKNKYSLLDARDGWGYMAYPITLTEVPYP